MRQRIGHNCDPVTGNIGAPKKEVNEWRGEKQETRNGIEKVRHGVEIAETLMPFEVRRKERIVCPEYLDHATRPANSLAYMAGKALGRQARCLRDVDVGSIPPACLHAERGVRVFRHSFGRDAANFFKSGTPQYGTRTTKEGCIPEVAAILDDAIEQFSFIRDRLERMKISLERVRRIKEVGCLQHSQLLIFVKPSQRHLQKATSRHVVAVEDGNVRRCQILQRTIDIPR